MLRHPAAPLLLCSLLLALAVGCNDDDLPPEKIAFSGIEGAGSDDKRPPLTAASAAASAGASATAKAPTPGSGTLKPKQHGSIDACCAALRAKAARETGSAKQKTSQAAQTCSGMAGLVRTGQVPQDRAIAQIRSAHGGSLPSACRVKTSL